MRDLLYSSSFFAHGRQIRVLLVGSGGKWLPRLEQRLEAAEYVHPANAGNARGRLRRALELVVDDAEEAEAAVLRLDLPGYPACLLGGHVRVVERAPAVHEPPRRVVIEHVLVAPQLVVGAERAVVVRGDRDPRAVEVARGELRRRESPPRSALG